MKPSGSHAFYDISPRITPAIAVFPGDTPFERSTLCDVERGDGFTLSRWTTTPHLGAHADGPIHYHAGGSGIGERALELYFGRCEVIHIPGLKPSERIEMRHLGAWAPRAERVLFATGSFPDPDQWSADFNSLSPEVVNYVRAHGVRLVGIDTPSVDPASEKVLASHHAIARADLAVLEGLILAHVPVGIYTLCAFPLRVIGGDASPVRAVLIQAELGELGRPLS